LIDFSFGYDTQGVQDFAASDFRNPALLFNGFYVGDMDATGKIDVAGASVRRRPVGGGGTEPGHRARRRRRRPLRRHRLQPARSERRRELRLSELATNFINELEYGEPALSPLAIFDVTGSLTAKLFAFLKIDLGLVLDRREVQHHPTARVAQLQHPLHARPDAGDRCRRRRAPAQHGPVRCRARRGRQDRWRRDFTVTGTANDLAVTAFGFTQHYKSASGWKKILALGGEGNDKINLSGVTGNIGFELEGNAGDDTIQGGTAATGDGRILGGAGDDNITGGGGADVIFGEAGNDNIAGGGGTDWLFGDSKPEDAIQDSTIVVDPKLSDGNDTVKGDAGTDLIFGGGGNDVLEGGSEADVIIGDGGKATVNASKVATAVQDTDGSKGGNDSIKGDAGADLIYGGAGNDTVLGGSENDKIFGETGADSIQGEAGNDTVSGGTQNDNIDGGAGADSISADEGHDTVTGGTENDWISGGTGNDSLAGGGGNDTVFGNSDLDTITGDDGADFLEGGHGNDTVTGGIGNDTLVAGYGSDILDGQDGNDSYNITSRGGSTTESTTSYDSGGLGDTDILTVNGTATADTFLLRAMADAYFPSTNDLDHLISKILKSGKAEKLDLLKEGLTNRYGFYGVPDGMLAAVETAFNANPIDD
jgi:Ca2+-binding RTX toxin-like protein